MIDKELFHKALYDGAFNQLIFGTMPDERMSIGTSDISKSLSEQVSALSDDEVNAVLAIYKTTKLAILDAQDRQSDERKAINAGEREALQ
jgi:hypothetical protein